MTSKRRHLAKLNVNISGPTLPIGVRWSGDGPVVYVEITREEIARTVEVKETVIADYDSKGRLVGFEIVGALARGVYEIPVKAGQESTSEEWRLEEVCV